MKLYISIISIMIYYDTDVLNIFFSMILTYDVLLYTKSMYELVCK